MAKKPFDITEVLGAQVSKLDTSGRDQIQYINIDQIDDDPNNFYELTCIDELAANIELCGLQQPIRVRAGEGGRYTIVSGHRRRAALRMLVKSGHAEYQEAPCIVEQVGAISAAMQELRLIYANADSRQLSSAETAKQAQRVEALLYQLKEEGMEFPGRMRDHVAEACKISRSKLARLKMIRDHLLPIWMASYNKGDLKEDFAYELSRLPEDYQRKLYDGQQSGISLYGNNVEMWGQQLKALDDITCPKGEQYCTNADNMWQRQFKQDYTSKNCDGRYGRTAKCCKGCGQLYCCKFACEKFAPQIAKYKAESKIAKRTKREETKAKEAAHIAEVAASWARFSAARKAAKMTTQYFLKQIYAQNPANRSYMYDTWTAKKWAEQERGEGFTSNSHCFADDLSQDDLIRMADVLGCSVDYLLGHADDPRPFTGAWTSAQEESPDEGRFLFVCDAFGCVQPSVFWNGNYKDATPRSVGNDTLKHIHYWMYQPAMPNEMNHNGQETLERLMQEREGDHEPRDV